MNAGRLGRLTALEAIGRPVTVEAVLAAFIEPSLRLRGEGIHGGRFTRLLSRLLIEGSEASRAFPRDRHASVLEQFQRTLARTLARTLPRLSAEELRWRLYFALGVLAFTYAGALPRLPFAPHASGNEEWLLSQLIQFLAAGLRAPPLVDDAETAA